MAIVWGLRLAIALTPVVARVVQSSGGDLQSQANVIARFLSALNDPGEDAGDLSTRMSSAEEGMLFVVTDYAAPIETRKLQIRFQRTPTGGVIEDVDVITFHLLKLDGSTPTISWDPADYAAAEALFDTWWGAIKVYCDTTTALGQYRWYASGSEWDVTPAPYNPARRITERNVAGTGAGNSLPPQCAMSVTELTATRPTWGRFYLPGGSLTNVDVSGIIKPAIVTAITGATVTLYNGLRALSPKLLPVVFTRARGEYTRKDGTVLPAKVASVHTVDKIQMDNLFDVIRSRRWDTVTQRVTTTLT